MSEQELAPVAVEAAPVVKTYDVKELLEVLIALDLVAVQLVKALKDGIQITDLQYLLPILKDIAKVVEAVKGVKEIPAEIKDLDIAEATELFNKVLAIIKDCKEATK
jgi:hypothetical protein